jgi:hypothetical protein
MLEDELVVGAGDFVSVFITSRGGSSVSSPLGGLGSGAQGHGNDIATNILGEISSAQKEFVGGEPDGHVAAEQQKDATARADDVADLFGAQFVFDALAPDVRRVGDEIGMKVNAGGFRDIDARNFSHGVHDGFFHSATEAEGGKGKAEKGENPTGLHGKVSMKHHRQEWRKLEGKE